MESINQDAVDTRELLELVPKTVCSAQNLGRNAHDVPVRAATEIELYDKVEESIRQHIGYVLFVRIQPEQTEAGWYCRIQFVKPEDIATL